MKWPWIARWRYEFLVNANAHLTDRAEIAEAELERERGRARRRERRNGSTMVPHRLSDGIAITPNQFVRQAVASSDAEVVPVTMSMVPAHYSGEFPKRERMRPSPTTAPVTPTDAEVAIAKAIRTVAGNDRPLARHLRTYADEQLALDVPVQRIIREILKGQEVPL